jgi:hypothetical protein
MRGDPKSAGHANPAEASKACRNTFVRSLRRLRDVVLLGLAAMPLLHRAEVVLGPADDSLNVTQRASDAMTEDERVQRQKWLARGVTVFVVLSVDEDFQEWRDREGAGFEHVVREAIAALNVLCDRERTGPWVSAEARTRMREQLARMQALVDAGGVTDEVRQIARAVVEEIFPDAEQWFKDNPGAAKYGPPPRRSTDT